MQHEDRTVGKWAIYFIGFQAIATVVILTLMHLFVDMDAAYTSRTPWILEWFDWLGMCFPLAFVLWHSSLTKGVLRGFGAAFITIFVAWFAEYLGVTYGLVFGWYHYTHFFEPQILGVPLFICIAWEPILYSSYLMTDWLMPSDLSKEKSLSKKLIPIIFMSICGTIIVTVWDLMADPVSVQRGYWAWHEGGPYMRDIVNGVPISNYLGWLGVAFTSHIVYRLILETAPKTRHNIYLNVYGPLFLYLTLYCFFVLMALWFLKRIDVVMIGTFSMGGFLILAFSKLYLCKNPLAQECWRRLEDIPDEIRAQEKY